LLTVILPYLSILLFIMGTAYRFFKWSGAPRHLPWVLYPIPSYPGQLQYMASEILTFRTLLHYNLKVWVGSYLFHIGLAFFLAWFLTFLAGWPMNILGKIGGILILGGATYLFILRLISRSMRTVSSFVEFFNLGIFILFTLTGICVVYGQRVDLVEIRDFFLGLLRFAPKTPPKETSFLILLFIAEGFLVYLPFSKMVHYISKYFSYHRVKWGH